MKTPPFFDKTHSGNMCIVLEGNINYDSFPLSAEHWAKRLNLDIVSRADGPDARVWDCSRDGKRFWLSYDDWFPTISLEPQDIDASEEIKAIGVLLQITDNHDLD